MSACCCSTGEPPRGELVYYMSRREARYLICFVSIKRCFYSSICIVNPPALLSLDRAFDVRPNIRPWVRSIHIRISQVSRVQPLLDPTISQLKEYPSNRVIGHGFDSILPSFLGFVADSLESVVLRGAYLAADFDRRFLNTLTFKNVTELTAPFSIVFTDGSPFMHRRPFDECYGVQETTWPALHSFHTWLDPSTVKDSIEAELAFDIRHLQTLENLSIVFLTMEEDIVQSMLAHFRVPSSCRCVSVELRRSCHAVFNFPYWNNFDNAGLWFDPRLVFVVDALVLQTILSSSPSNIREKGADLLLGLRRNSRAGWADVLRKASDRLAFAQRTGTFNKGPGGGLLVYSLG